MAGWRVEEAGSRPDEVVRLARDEGPRIVTRDGVAVAVVVHADEYRRLTGRCR